MKDGNGAFTKGGRGGEVFIVTTTEDYGVDEPVIKGSFREAVEATMPRTVVFEVSGIIELKRPLKIEHPYMWITFQRAGPLTKFLRLAQKGPLSNGAFFLNACTNPFTPRGATVWAPLCSEVHGSIVATFRIQVSIANGS